MIDLTEMAELVDRSGPDGYTMLVATASKDGAPDLAFKGSVMVWDKDHLAFWERAHGVTLSATRDSMAYAPNGLGYGASNLSIIVRRGAVTDTVVVSRLGRVRR